MQAVLTLQNTIDDASVPAHDTILSWLQLVLAQQEKSLEVCVRIVSVDEMTALNAQFRQQNKPTNVLSFPFTTPDFIDETPEYLGDLVLCAAVISDEARAQHKPLEQHWAHLIVHGTLHLLGYDHIKDADAQEMEALEIRLLAQIHIPNPYLENAPHD